ncbi:MAG: YhcN/YlaJ family sporulation lipoprotein [Candidatus Pristimantibacillus sp.]
MSNKYAILLTSMALVLTTTACGTGMKTNQYNTNSTRQQLINDEMYVKRSTENRTNMNSTMNKMNTNHMNMNHMNTNNMNSNNMRMKNAQENHNISENIAKRVGRVKGVGRQSVIVQDRNIIVGIQVKKGENVRTVEQNVRRSVEGSEPGYTVYVSGDNGINTRIQNIQTQMVPLDGHPVRNFTEDVGILIQDIGRAITAPLR